MKKERIYYSTWGYDKIEGYSLIPKGEEIVTPYVLKSISRKLKKDIWGTACPQGISMPSGTPHYSSAIGKYNSDGTLSVHGQIWFCIKKD